MRLTEQKAKVIAREADSEESKVIHREADSEESKVIPREAKIIHRQTRRKAKL